MRSAWGLAIVVVLAGCSDGGGPNEGDRDAARVEGIVTDTALRPVAGARILVTGAVVASTDASGAFSFPYPAMEAVVIQVEADGYRATSASVGAATGAVRTMMVRLEALPDADPYTNVESFRGILHCAVVAIVPPEGDPGTHPGVRCSTVMENDQQTWDFPISPEATAVILELAWNQTSEMSNTMVLKARVKETGQSIGHAEGLSIVKLQLAQAQVRAVIDQGQGILVSADAGAGDTEQEEGSVGAFFEQSFEIYATSFFNQPADPGYSIGNPG